MKTIRTFLLALLAITLSLADARAQPGPPPSSWTQNGSSIQPIDPTTCLLFPSTVTGGCKGPGTINAHQLYQDGVLVTGGGGSGITALTGDVSAAGTGTVTATLATVNSNVGTFGDSSHVAQITLNGKGLATAAASIAIALPFSSITGTIAPGQLPLATAGAFGAVKVDNTTIVVSAGVISAVGGGGGGGSSGNFQDFVAPGGFTPGSTTTLTLSGSPVSASLLSIFFDGVVQSHNTWGLAGALVTFNAAIPVGVQVVEAQWLSASVGGSGMVVGTTVITGGTIGNLFYHAASNLLGEMTTTGSGTVVALKTSPALVTPSIDVATGVSLSTTGLHTSFNATSIPAGGTQDVGYLFSSTAHFGLVFGSGPATSSQAQGTIYARSDGAPMFNTNGTTGWATLVYKGTTWAAGQCVQTNGLTGELDTTGSACGAGGGGTSPGGASGNVQYNNTVFGGNAGFTYDGTSLVTLGVAGASVGQVQLFNATSGSITLKPPTGALGTVNVTIFDANDTIIGKATTDTLTNKTYDTGGTGNVFKIAGTTISAISGTGSVCMTTSCTMVTPALGTPASGIGTNLTGIPISSAISGLASGIATFLGTPSSANLAAALTDETGTGAAVFANGAVLIAPVLGTPASGTLTNATGLPISTGVSGLGAGIATWLATPNSANLAAAISDPTGSGSAVFAQSPTLVTPILGVASATSVAATTFTVGSGNVNPQTGTSYTLLSSDNGLTVTLSNASAITLTVPSGLPAGFYCQIVQLGAGQVTITPSSTTLRDRNGLKTAGQWAGASLSYLSSNTYLIVGDTTP